MNFLAGRRSVFLILPALTGGCGGLLVSADNTDAAAKEPSDAATKNASNDVAPAEAGYPMDVPVPVFVTDARVVADALLAEDVQVDSGCGDLQTDPYNCGVCGNDCDAGTCALGGCTMSEVTVLATEQAMPAAIAVDEAHLYWINEGTVTGGGDLTPSWYIDGQLMECSKGGCGGNPTILAKGFTEADSVTDQLAVDTTNVYWGVGLPGSSGIESCAVGGCAGTPTAVVDNAFAVEGFALGASDDIYFTVEEGVAVSPLGGGDGGWTTFASSQEPYHPMSVVVDATDVYWGDMAGQIWRCSLSGCGDAGPTVIFQNAAGGTWGILTADTNNLYWTSGVGGDVNQCAKADCQGTALSLVSGLSQQPWDIAVDGTDVYWAGEGIYRCAIGGCGGQPTALWLPPDDSSNSNPNYAQVLALDESRVYFTVLHSSGKGAIASIAK